MHTRLCRLGIILTYFQLRFSVFYKIKFLLFVFLSFKCLFCIKIPIFTNKSFLVGEKAFCDILFGGVDACCMW